MNSAIWIYLAFGLGFYIGSILREPVGFFKEDAFSLFRGFILSVPFWPFGVIHQTLWAIWRLQNNADKEHGG